MTLTDVTTEDEGVYTLEVSNTVLTDLTLVSRDIYVDVIVTGMEEFEEITFSVYPNPATGNVISLNADKIAGTSQVQILNTSGQILSEQLVTGNKSQIDISNLSAGIYLLKVTNGKSGISMIKFIKN